MRRKLIMGVLALALPAASIGVTASPASAKTKPLPFTGPATGTVTCSAPKMKVSFSPPLTVANTGTTTITVKGNLKSCVTTGSNVTVKIGKISGSFTTTGGCLGLIAGSTTPITISVQWKGKTTAGGKASIANSSLTVNGAGPAINGAGDVGFELPNPNLGGGSVTGSFAGAVSSESFAYGTQNESTIGALCLPTSKTTKKGIRTKPAKGLKKINVKSGTINIP